MGRTDINNNTSPNLGDLVFLDQAPFFEDLCYYPVAQSRKTLDLWGGVDFAATSSNPQSKSRSLKIGPEMVRTF